MGDAWTDASAAELDSLVEGLHEGALACWRGGDAPLGKALAEMSGFARLCADRIRADGVRDDRDLELIAGFISKGRDAVEATSAYVEKLGGPRGTAGRA